MVTELLGNERQKVAAILLPNSIDFIVAYLAIVHSGHMALLLDPAYKHLEHQAVISQMRPELLIADESNVESYELGDTRFLAISDLLSYDSREPVNFLRLPAEEQIASLTFTSGTTGKPKTVPYTHTNHLWNIEVCSRAWDWNQNDSLLVTVPLSHFNGVVMALSGAIYHGNTMFLHRWFDELATLEALASGKITMFNHAASAYVKLVALPQADFDLSKVRLCTSGAAPLPPAVWQEFKDRYGIEIVETYGSSETGRIAGNRLHERVLGSPGKPFPEVNLRISRAGEVEVKSAGLFPGYYKNPAATKAALTDDGFWRTGDIGELKDGYVYLKGRIQERIRRFGYTISPRDVEWALHQLPQVKDAYVMGVQKPDQPADELVYFITGNITEPEVRGFTKQNMLFAWRPDKIIFLDDLPKTRSGKTKIAELKKILEDES
jgi:acyl-CoA synthetase (AMP-forming)/AMP-acid ligase II